MTMTKSSLMMLNHRDELPALLNECGLTGTGVEVGVLRGGFATHILKHWKGRRLYLVDGWRHFPGLIDANNVDHNENLNNLAVTFMAVYEFGERAVILRDLSVKAAKLFSDDSLDFVYIDASHDYENVLADLTAWYPKVKSGGIFAGHDYFDGTLSYGPQSPDGVFGVKSAVDQFFGNYKTQVQVSKENFPTWWIEKK